MAGHACSVQPHSRRSRYIFWGFLIVATFYLLLEHRTHVLYFLPYLLVLACPLMHLFHHGHSHQHAENTKAAADEVSISEKPQ